MQFCADQAVQILGGMGFMRGTVSERIYREETRPMHSTDHGNKAIITCAITGVLTDPGQHHVPVTPEQLAKEARRAYDAGAAVVHVHFRNQEPGKGHLPSWDPQVARDCVQA
eukprot:gene3274-biopygen2420